MLSEKEANERLAMMRGLVAQPMPADPNWNDPEPAHVEGSNLLVGNKYHAGRVDGLVQLGVTAMLNCASGGISRLPMDELQDKGILYHFTNVRRDDTSYPILFDHKNMEPSKHLQIAKMLYSQVCHAGGKVLFFCVAGQNRSAALAVAVLMLFGHPIESILKSLSKNRPFVLENEGFQRQLVELEFLLRGRYSKKMKLSETLEMFTFGSLQQEQLRRHSSSSNLAMGVVEIELLIPGLCTMDVKIPSRSSVSVVKEKLIAHANEFLLSYSDPPTEVAKSWVVLAMFGYEDTFDFPLEDEAIQLDVQLHLMASMFDLVVAKNVETGEQEVTWTSKCRFALVIFAVNKVNLNGQMQEEPWTFEHKERPGAPATFLEYNLLTTHLRAWDFVTGQPYCSLEPTVFSFSSDPREKRQFMRISTSANKPVQFHAPGEGGILGMGANAIVHRVKLGEVTETMRSTDKDFMLTSPEESRWDAAVKRPFSLRKMLAFLENRSEAGLAKRIRLASSLNSDGRVVEFYGLGVGLSSNCRNEHEFKFEAMLLARYEAEFSTYTMKKFMDHYLTPWNQVSESERESVKCMQETFSIISVKVLLVSLLNSFRDLTLMGVQAFDFNHLSNILVSRDHQNCRLIDIDGDSKGSIQLDESAEYVRGRGSSVTPHTPLHKPSLDIDLNTVLPSLIEQLILGKGRGRGFVTNTRSDIWRSAPDVARRKIEEVLRRNFYPSVEDGDAAYRSEKHIHKVAIWFYAMMKKQAPWGNWTRDIYDAMRCIDHLPVS